MFETAIKRPRERQRRYMPVRTKFVIALLVATAWMLFSIIISRGWVRELGAVTHPLFALFAISFIAYIPGFMNAFLMASLLLDKRPDGVRRPFIRR